MKENKYELEMYGNTYDIILRRGSYSTNKTLAIAMICVDKSGFEEPYATLTVNIDDSDVLANKTRAFVDTNNLGEKILTWIVDNKLGKHTGYRGCSGFCSYPLVEFDENVIKNMRSF